MSLKFEKDDFYHKFIIPMKHDRDLSAFVVNLLRLFYANDAVKKEYASFMGLVDPFEAINRQLDRISLEHSKTVMSTEALKDYVKEQEKSSGAPLQTNTLDKLHDRLLKLESIVPGILSSLDKISLVNGVALGAEPSSSGSVGFESKKAVDDSLDIDLFADGDSALEDVPVISKPASFADGDSALEDVPVISKPASFTKMLRSVK